MPPEPHLLNYHAEVTLEPEKEPLIRVHQFSKLVNDEHFDRLDLKLKNANIFSVLGIERMEIRHSNFLAWLLDPGGTHGLGSLFLKRFLRDVSLLDSPESVNGIGMQDINARRVEVRREWRNIDILLVADDLTVCIENKVDSYDSTKQLARYREIVNKSFPSHRKTFVYLTPDGREPSDEEEQVNYINYSYQQIAGHLHRILSLHRESMVPSVGIYISDYLDNLRTNLMKESPLNALAKQLYESHKEVLDFIYENKPDAATIACDYIKQKVEAEGWVPGSCSSCYVRFLTQGLNGIISKNAKGWKNREQFVFEIRLWEQKGAVEGYFATVISPGGTSMARAVIREAIDKIEDRARRANIRARNWISQIRLKIKANNPDEAPDDQEAVRVAIDEIWPRIREIVEKVDQKLMSEADRLVPLKDMPED